MKSGSPQTGLANGSPPTKNGKTVVDDVPKQTSGQVISGQMTSGSAQKVVGKQGYDYFRISLIPDYFFLTFQCLKQIYNFKTLKPIH